MSAVGRNRLFLSHAYKDKAIADLFKDKFIIKAVGMEEQDIFYTSNPVTGIRPGTNFRERIRQEIEYCAAGILLISESFYASQFCMCEMGALWVLGKKIIPIVIPKLKPSAISAVMADLHAVSIDNRDELDKVRDEIELAGFAGVCSTYKSKSMASAFLRDVKPLLPAASPMEATPEFPTAIRTIREKMLQQTNALPQYLRDYWVQLADMIQSCAMALHPLPTYAQQLIRLYLRGLDMLDRIDERVIEKGTAEGFIVKLGNGKFSINLNHKGIVDATQLIQRTQDFCNAREELRNEFKDRMGLPPNMFLDDYWTTILHVPLKFSP